MPLPGFLIIGTMKGGTSALARAVSRHPDVFIPSGKEVRFFDHHYDEGLEWYESRFASAPLDAVVGEASPGYMYRSTTHQRIAAILPEARFVAILRNPVDRAYSHYRHNVRRGRESRNFRQALDSESEIDRSDHSQDVYAYMDLGRYCTQLRGLEQLVGRDSLMVLENSELRFSESAVMNRLWDFIGVNPEFRPTVRMPLRKRVKNLLSPSRRSRLGGYPPMDPEIRAELLEKTRTDVEDLEEWWDRDLSSWRL